MGARLFSIRGLIKPPGAIVGVDATRALRGAGSRDGFNSMPSKLGPPPKPHVAFPGILASYSHDTDGKSAALAGQTVGRTSIGSISTWQCHFRMRVPFMTGFRHCSTENTLSINMLQSAYFGRFRQIDQFDLSNMAINMAFRQILPTALATVPQKIAIKVAIFRTGSFCPRAIWSKLQGLKQVF